MARHPRDYSGERRTEKFTLKLSPTEKRKLDVIAEQGRMAKSELIRSYLPLEAGTNNCRNNTLADPHEWRRSAPWKVDAVREVNRIGVNINQLTHHMHQIGRIPETAVLRAIQGDLKTALTKLL
jgi:hypothetical protein